MVICVMKNASAKSLKSDSNVFRDRYSGSALISFAENLNPGRFCYNLINKNQIYFKAE